MSTATPVLALASVRLSVRSLHLVYSIHNLGPKTICVSFGLPHHLPLCVKKRIPPGIPDNRKSGHLSKNSFLARQILKISSSDGPGQTVTSQYFGSCQKPQGGLWTPVAAAPLIENEPVRIWQGQQLSSRSC